MKQGWEIKNIGSICDIKTGKLDANAASNNGLYPFFTCSQTPLRIDNYAYDCECVLVAGNGELNAKYYKGKFNAYQRTYIITAKETSKEVSVKYLYKFFSKYVEQLRKLSIGGVIKYIKLGNLTDATLPIPPLPEQERIVAELDCLSGVIGKLIDLGICAKFQAAREYMLTSIVKMVFHFIVAKRFRRKAKEMIFLLSCIYQKKDTVN